LPWQYAKFFAFYFFKNLNRNSLPLLLLSLSIGAMDDELLKLLHDAEIPTFSMSSGLTLGDFGWGSSTFNKMGREKISLIQTFTRWGVEVIISDVDTVWLENPIHYMAQYPEADVLTSSDHLSASFPGDKGLEDPSAADSAANIGIMVFRPSAAELADEWVKILDSDDKLWDQNVFNDLMHRGETRDHQFNSSNNRPDRLFLGYDGKLKFGILPVSMFCSGHTYFTQRMPDTVFVDPYVVHATFQFSGTAGKRHRFRERLLWNDEPSYFKHENGFISANNNIPESLLTDVEDVRRDGSIESTYPHFTLVHYQFLALRAMFAAGTILNRAVVLPDFWCGFDRWWAPHTGIIPGSNFKTPFRCPADHVLELEM
jgi:arabinosyltransferase